MPKTSGIRTEERSAACGAVAAKLPRYSANNSPSIPYTNRVVVPSARPRRRTRSSPFLRPSPAPAAPPHRNRKVNRIYDKTVYAWRRGIENLFAKQTENRRLALRVDKLEVTFGGFIVLALIKTDIC
jgi:hypothetical protein